MKSNIIQPKATLRVGRAAVVPDLNQVRLAENRVQARVAVGSPEHRTKKPQPEKDCGFFVYTPYFVA